jgi:hypothetical protein
VIPVEESRLWIDNCFRSHYECFLKFVMDDSVRADFLSNRDCRVVDKREKELIVHRIDSELPVWFPVKPYDQFSVWQIQNWAPRTPQSDFETWKAKDRIGYLLYDTVSNRCFVCVFKDDTTSRPSPYRTNALIQTQ